MMIYAIIPPAYLHVNQGSTSKNKCTSFIYKFSFPTTSMSLVGSVGKVNNKHVYDSTCDNDLCNIVLTTIENHDTLGIQKVPLEYLVRYP